MRETGIHEGISNNKVITHHKSKFTPPKKMIEIVRYQQPITIEMENQCSNEARDTVDVDAQPSPSPTNANTNTKAAAASSSSSNKGGAPPSTTAAASEREYIKCKLCVKRLGRRNCIHQACVKCCTDPNCEPHNEARLNLKKRASLLDGTDWISRAAAAKRASKVTPGTFFDANINYLGETVVIWDMKEYFKNVKWREDAIRRSKKRALDYYVDLSCLEHGKRRRNKKQVVVMKKEEEQQQNDDGEGESAAANEMLDTPATTALEMSSKKPMSRKKRFKSICEELYQQSLAKKSG